MGHKSSRTERLNLQTEKQKTFRKMGNMAEFDENAEISSRRGSSNYIMLLQSAEVTCGHQRS